MTTTNTTTTDSTTTETTTEDANTTQSTATKPVVLTAEQEINALRAAHQFFSNFDRVPGFLANQWSQALDTVAVVANSLITKTASTKTQADDVDAAATETTTTDTSTDTTVTQ